MRDFHSHRPYATLTTARSKQISDALGIKDPSVDLRCTACHAPLHGIAGERSAGVKISEGVSCESCHGPAEGWLRSHTRSDYTHAQRTLAGMRDLKNLYQRANTCVACHQAVDLPILKAGHPELIFELDGQTVSEPRHWREATNYSGGQAWLVGQAVAFRELSWQMSREGAANSILHARWQAALWMMQKVGPIISSPLKTDCAPTRENALAGWKAADELARQAAEMKWTSALSRKAMVALAATGPEFRQREITNEYEARRAERLVLALDRLINDLRKNQASRAGEAELNSLFKLAQSRPDFDREAFSEALGKFAIAIE